MQNQLIANKLTACFLDYLSFQNSCMNHSFVFSLIVSDILSEIERYQLLLYGKHFLAACSEGRMFPYCQIAIQIFLPYEAARNPEFQTNHILLMKIIKMKKLLQNLQIKFRCKKSKIQVY